MIVDWSKPILAEPTRAGLAPIPVAIDPTYHRRPDYVPVRFPTNLWVAGAAGGTWYFTDDGQSIGGKNERGTNDARFRIVNVGAE